MYCTQADLVGLIPQEWLTQAVDDDGDGTADTITDVLQAAQDEIDSKLATRYALPLDLSGTLAGMAAKLRHIMRYLAAAIAYGRRGMHDQFPWVDQIKDIRRDLSAIENGTLLLFPNLTPVEDDALIITTPNRADSRQLST